MKRFFHEELAGIEADLIAMSQKAYENVRAAISSFENRDTDQARHVIEEDEALDELEVKLDHDSTRYLGLRHPVARELRLLAITIKTSHDLERVGDEATTVAKRTLHLLESVPHLRTRIDPSPLLVMGDMAAAMLRRAIDAFLTQNVDRAIAVVQDDRKVDTMNRENLDRFTEMISDDPDSASGFLDLIFISRALERIADHATNIAEEVVFLVSGSGVRHTGLKDSGLTGTG